MAGELQTKRAGARAKSAAALLALVLLAGCAAGDLSSRAVIAPEPPRQRSRIAAAPRSASISAFSEFMAAPMRMPRSKPRSIKRSSGWWRPRSGPICITRSRSSIRPRSTPSRCRPASFTSRAGLLALANDTSELASVLAHEMAHVIARHAAIREDQVRQAPWSAGSRATCSPIRRWARSRSPNPRSRSRASRARRNSKPTASASASPRAPDSILMARRASSPRWGATPNCKAASAQDRSASRSTFSPRIRRRRSACAMRSSMPGNMSRPAPARATRRPISQGLDGLDLSARIRAKASCAGGAFCIPSSASPSRRPKAMRSTTRAQAVFGVKDGGEQALRLDVVRVPAEQSLPEYLNSGWIENIDAQASTRSTINGFQGRDRDRQGRPMVVPALCGALRQRSLSLHLRRQGARRAEFDRAVARHASAASAA